MKEKKGLGAQYPSSPPRTWEEDVVDGVEEDPAQYGTLSVVLGLVVKFQKSRNPTTEVTVRDLN